MDELETLQRAKLYLELLASGFDPISGAKLPETDSVKQVKIISFFRYVSEVLEKVIENGGVVGKKNKSKKKPFSITQRELEAYCFDPEPIPVSAITGKINALVESDDMVKLKHTSILYRM